MHFKHKINKANKPFILGSSAKNAVKEIDKKLYKAISLKKI